MRHKRCPHATLYPNKEDPKMTLPIKQSVADVLVQTKKGKFRQCLDCPWSADIAKRLHRKKLCAHHHDILDALRAEGSLVPSIPPPVSNLSA
jgi:hypothetical protein